MESEHPIDATFFDALMKEDELGSVIRAHLNVEYLVDQLLGLHLPNAAALRPIHLEYSDRVRLLEACGYEQGFVKPLHALGSLRNDFAHKLDFKLSGDRLERIYEAMDPDDKQRLNEMYDDLRKRELIKNAPRRMKKLSPKNLFTMYATSIRASLIVAYLRKAGRVPPGVRPGPYPPSLTAG
jgi:hypothetical protein